LTRLRRRGLVKRVGHMPTEGPHWELTAEGRARAQDVLDDLGLGTV
jgi:hypothetical protein